MKRIFYFVGVCLMVSLGFASCEDKADNPGDFSLKSELKLTMGYSDKTGESFDLVVMDERDTVYKYLVYIDEPVLDADGNPVLDAEGNEKTEKVGVMRKAIGPKAHGHIIEYAPIVVDWVTQDRTDGNIKNVLHFNIESNARWFLGPNTPSIASASALYTSVGSNSGGGDGEIAIELTFWAANQLTYRQQVISQDSSVMCFVNFDVHGARFPR